MSTSTFTCVLGVARELAAGTPSRGSHRQLAGTLRESANVETSTRPRRSARRSPRRCSDEDRRVDLDAFGWLLTDDGQALLAAPSRSAPLEDDPLAAHESLRRTAPGAASERLAAALTQAALRAGRGRRSSATSPPGCTSRPTGSSRPPGCRVADAPGRAAAGVRRVDASIDLGCGIGGDLVALASAGLTAAGVDLDPERVAVAAANLAALGLGGAVQVADATTRRPHRLRRRVRRPGAPRRRRPDLLDRQVVAAVAVRRVAADPGRVREDRARHPARPGPGRRRGRVGQRPRRGQGGGAVVGAAGRRAYAARR